MSAKLAPTKQPDSSTPAKATAVAFEDAHRNEPVEHGAIIAPDGTTLYTAKGTTNMVSFSPQQLSLVANITFTHNHPLRHSFSVEDIELASRYKMQEMRVITADFRHFAWDFASVDPASIANEYLYLKPYAEHYVLGRVIAGVIEPADVTVEVVNATWVRVAKSLGFKYEREPS